MSKITEGEKMKVTGIIVAISEKEKPKRWSVLLDDENWYGQFGQKKEDIIEGDAVEIEYETSISKSGTEFRNIKTIKKIPILEKPEIPENALPTHLSREQRIEEMFELKGKRIAKAVALREANVFHIGKNSTPQEIVGTAKVFEKYMIE